MNWTIFKYTWKRSWKLLLGFLVLLCFYLGVIISLIDPKDMEKVQELFKAMEGFMGAFSISIESMTSPLNYTASTFFSVLVMAITMIFYVIQANLLIAKPVDDTSLACTLAAPVKRGALVLTNGVYLIFSMAVLFAGIFATGYLMLTTYGSFDAGAYLNLIGVTFCLCTCVAMLSFFLSVAFCGSKAGMGIAAGAPLVLLFLQMLGGAGGEKTQWISKLTPFGYLDSVGIVSGEVNTMSLYLVFGAGILLLLAAAVAVFDRRRLSI